MYYEEYGTAWTSKAYDVKWWRHPTCINLTLTIAAMQIPRCIYNSDLTRGCVVAGVLHSVWSELSHQGTTLQCYS